MSVGTLLADAPRISLAVLLLLALPLAAVPETDEPLWHHRNLGKAFYENPATQYEAVAEFEKALALAPGSVRERINYGLALLRSGKEAEGIAELVKAQQQNGAIPHTWFNLGIAYKRASLYEEAIEQLEGMLALVPEESITHYNLGVLYKLEGDRERALVHFETAARLEPRLAGPHFQLTTIYRQSRRPEEAQREMALFREIKRRNTDAAVPEDLEWSFYSEIYETIDPVNAVDNSEPAAVKLSTAELAQDSDATSAGLTVLDADGDGTPDLLAFSASGAQLLLGGRTPTTDGLEELRGIVDVSAGDINNDGLADLCVVTRLGVLLYANVGGSFRPHPVDLPSGSWRRAVWLDFDHDYDADLFLLGTASKLLRNEGETGFVDRTADFPFVDGEAVDGARIDLVADTQGRDLAVAYTARRVVLYRDRMGGRYEAQPIAGAPPAPVAVTAFDADNDGWTDLALAGEDGVCLLINDRRRGFEVRPTLAGAEAPLTWADLENRGVSDLVAGGAVYRNRGLGQFGNARHPDGLPASTVAIAAADYDGDGRIDLATVDDEGRLLLLTNRTETTNHWIRVGLEGVKSPRLAPGAEIEIKAGSRYQKKTYDGTPVSFGLGNYEQVDAVRITWPNGLIQNESRQPTGGAVTYKEAQRLSGSCPMIYTWNGRNFEYITDVLGVAPLGASAGDGEFFPVDHDEVIQIAGESLVTQDGSYQIRIVEELREVAYLDEVRLTAVDHPAAVEIFTNDKFRGPPFPEFRLFGVEAPIRPRTAHDHRGRDVRATLLASDRSYVDGFARDFSGVAEMHYLELDFGSGVAADGAAVLVLSGWVDWADGSTFLRVAQGGSVGLVMPYLEVLDKTGRWRTAIEDMGIPAGKPKTIVVDLTDRFLSSARRVRIVTNLCVYWDEIYLSETTAPPEARLTDLHAEDAQLAFGGFSRVVVHPERKQPEHFVYAERRSTAMWNPTPGLYTRYGDVRQLLAEVDDQLAILGSGDELRLTFDAGRLPDLPAGWRRDFLLAVDGWAKDGDANTAHSQTVGPLPYHGMPQYPYAAPHHFPDGEAHRRYIEDYNTRPALRLIRPLAGSPDAKQIAR